MKKAILAAVAALAVGMAANAGSVETATEALNNLHNAQFNKAITGFSDAISAGDLSADDLEFAYYNRAIAELWKRDYKDAASDFSIAVHMAPKDEKAQDYLDFANEYLERKPPDMPIDINTAVGSILGTLLSPVLSGVTAQKWMDVDPILQHCLTFKYGMEPMTLAKRSIAPDNDILDTYFDGCQQLIGND